MWFYIACIGNGCCHRPNVYPNCAGSEVALAPVAPGGWREREKAREESWAPPRDGGREEAGEEAEERPSFKERRPPPR